MQVEYYKPTAGIVPTMRHHHTTTRVTANAKTHSAVTVLCRIGVSIGALLDGRARPTLL